MNKEKEATVILNKNLGFMGRTITQSKVSYEQKHPDNIVVFNANIFAEGFVPNKLWYGDIDITIDSTKLILSAKEIGTTLYVLKERDGRFNNTFQPDYKQLAVWNTNL